MYLGEVKKIVDLLDTQEIEKFAVKLREIRDRGGRLFFIGAGGSAANASHAVNDFRKIASFECYAPTDNVSELTARVNDEGWKTVFAAWLKTSRLSAKDAILVLSVGGGNIEKNISPSIVEAIKYSHEIGADILGIVGRDGGETAKFANNCLIIPTVNSSTITPHSEAFQSVLLHLLVTHPKMKENEMKWESV